MRKKVKSSLHKRVVEVQKSSTYECKSSESECDSSSQSSSENPLKKPKPDIKVAANQLQSPEEEKNVAKSLQKDKTNVEENSGSDTEVLDSDDESSSSTSIEICEETTNKMAIDAIPSEHLKEGNPTQAIVPKSPKEESSYPGLIPLHHPKVFQENIGKRLASVPPKSFTQYSRESSQSTSLQGSSETVPEANAQSAEENDDIEIVGSKIVNPFSASRIAMRVREDQTSEDAGKYISVSPHVSVRKMLLQNGTTICAYKAPNATRLAVVANPSTSSTTFGLLTADRVKKISKNLISEVIRNVGTLSPNKQQLPPEEIVLSDSEEESCSAISEPLQGAAQVAPTEPSSSTQASNEAGKKPDSSRPFLSDSSDSDDDRMLIDESVTNEDEL